MLLSISGERKASPRTQIPSNDPLKYQLQAEQQTIHNRFLDEKTSDLNKKLDIILKSANRGITVTKAERIIEAVNSEVIKVFTYALSLEELTKPQRAELKAINEKVELLGRKLGSSTTELDIRQEVAPIKKAYKAPYQDARELEENLHKIVPSESLPKIREHISDNGIQEVYSNLVELKKSSLNAIVRIREFVAPIHDVILEMFEEVRDPQVGLKPLIINPLKRHVGRLFSGIRRN